MIFTALMFVLKDQNGLLDHMEKLKFRKINTVFQRRYSNSIVNVSSHLSYDSPVGRMEHDPP